MVFDEASPWLQVTTCAGRPGCAKSLADVRADATRRRRRRRRCPPAAPASTGPGASAAAAARRGAVVDVVATAAGYRVEEEPSPPTVAPSPDLDVVVEDRPGDGRPRPHAHAGQQHRVDDGRARLDHDAGREHRAAHVPGHPVPPGEQALVGPRRRPAPAPRCAGRRWVCTGQAGSSRSIGGSSDRKSRCACPVRLRPCRRRASSRSKRCARAPPVVDWARQQVGRRGPPARPRRPRRRSSSSTVQRGGRG